VGFPMGVFANFRKSPSRMAVKCGFTGVRALRSVFAGAAGTPQFHGEPAVSRQGRWGVTGDGGPFLGVATTMAVPRQSLGGISAYSSLLIFCKKRSKSAVSNLMSLFPTRYALILPSAKYLRTVFTDKPKYAAA
jgi:hypothetical protein